MKPAERIRIGSVALNVVDSGPVEGQQAELPLLFLHGFPDFHFGWRKQLPIFEERGYRVIAPDQRGYNLSDKPPDIADYNLDVLGQDLINLLDNLKLDKVVVIGHDWGGGTAWWLAHHHPERVKALIIINMPHPEVFKQYLRHNRQQLRKSWYFFAFQLPLLPEWIASRGNWVHFAQGIKGGARRGAFSEQDLQKYIEAWSQPGAFTGMVNWYRAAFRKPPKPFPETQVKPKTLIIWGVDDHYIETQQAHISLERCQQGRLVEIKHAGHWVHQEVPEQVNDLIQDFLDGLKTD